MRKLPALSLIILFLAGDSRSDLVFNFGLNSMNFPQEITEFRFVSDPASYSDSKLRHSEPGNSQVFRVDYSLPFWGKLDLNLGFSISGVLYQSKYFPSNSSSQAGQAVEEQLNFKAMAVEFGMMMRLFKLRMGSLDFIFESGATAGIGRTNGIISPEDISNRYESSDEKVSLSSSVTEDYQTGYGLLSRLKIAPRYSVVRFLIFCQYSIYPEMKSPSPKRWWNYGLGLGFRV